MDDLLRKHGLSNEGPAIRAAALPAVALALTKDKAGRSQFGGAPLVPADFAWPSYVPDPVEFAPDFFEKYGGVPKAPPGDTPLHFLVQVDLAELQQVVPRPELPSSGLLTFFYDVEHQPWGFDPKHTAASRVVLFASDAALNRASKSPEELPERGVAFWPILTVPAQGSRAYDQIPNLDRGDDAYFHFAEALENVGRPSGRGAHWMLGHAKNEQDDMQLEAQLVSNGLYCGDHTGYEDPRAKALEAGASEWCLLLQLDSDEQLHIEWGDVGKLFFWIRRDDLAARRFDRTLTILQSG